MDVFKELVFDVIIREVIKKLVASVPILGLPGINYIVTELILKFANMFYDKQKQLVMFYRFQFVNEVNQKSFEQEFIKLKKIANDPNATEKQKQEVLEAAKARMRFLVQHSQ